MTQIYAIANQKGGVGKTTTVLNVGAALAQQGSRVLLIDLDPQASLTAHLGLDPYRQERSSYSLVMFDEIALSRVLKPVGANLALVPGSIDLATAAIKIVQERQPLNRLQVALRGNQLGFDYVLLDTPPSLSVLTVSALLAAQYVLIPVQCNHMAMLGVRAMLDVMRRIRDQMGNPQLSLRGVVATLFDAEALYAQRVLDELRALLPGQILNTIIPYDTHIGDAPHQGKSALAYLPDSPGAAAYRRLAGELVKPKTGL